MPLSLCFLLIALTWWNDRGNDFQPWRSRRAVCIALQAGSSVTQHSPRGVFSRGYKCKGPLRNDSDGNLDFCAERIMVMGFVYLTQKDFCKMSRGLNPQVSWHPEPESTHISNHPTELLHLLLLRTSTGPARGGFSGNSSAAFSRTSTPGSLSSSKIHKPKRSELWSCWYRCSFKVVFSFCFPSVLKHTRPGFDLVLVTSNVSLIDLKPAGIEIGPLLEGSSSAWALCILPSIFPTVWHCSHFH